MPTVNPALRKLAKDRHAATRRLERREKWLERAGVTPELLQKAVHALTDGLTATKVVERGPQAGQEVPDHATRVRAGAELMEFVRLTVGLTARPDEQKATTAQIAVVVNVPDWLKPKPDDAKPALPLARASVRLRETERERREAAAETDAAEVVEADQPHEEEKSA